LPVLVIEVLSPTTWQQDLALEPPARRVRGKAWGYLELWAVPEYLTFDPREEFVPGQVRAWRRVQGRTVTWEPGAGGRYESALGVSFAVEGPLLRVYDEQGQAVPFDLEKSALLAEERAALAAERAALATERAALAAERAVRRQLEQRLGQQDQQIARLEQRLLELEAELRRPRGDNV
jgi:hypothetical protein